MSTAALTLDQLREAIEKLPHATSSDEVVRVEVRSLGGVDPRREPEGAATAPPTRRVAFTGLGELGAHTWRFVGPVVVERVTFGYEVAAVNPLAWVREQLGPRCVGVSGVFGRGNPVLTVDVR